jgi:hypothetical protein
MPKLVMYHATTAEAAKSIEKSRRFLPGKRGYAGAAIYFASDWADAVTHSFNGCHHGAKKQATVVITCEVNLGLCKRAGKHEVDKRYCDVNGFDSVRIQSSTTYAVYDHTRIVIQEFSHAASGKPWLPEKKDRKKRVAPALTSEGALSIIIAAIQTSTSKSLNASADIGYLYSQHAGLQKSIASKSLKAFCESHTELRWSEGIISLAVRPLTSEDALAVLIAEIRGSPSMALNASTDMKSLYLKHAGLQEAIASKSLKAFCESHTDLRWNDGSISLAVPPLTSEDALTILISEIRSSPSKALNASAGMKDLYLKHAGLQEVVASKSLKAFCESYNELRWNEGTVSLAAPPLTSSEDALAVLIAEVQASPSKALNASTDMACLYSRHRGLREVLPPSNLKAFCKLHTQLCWSRGSVVLAVTSQEALKILIAAIQTSPKKSLNVSSASASLCSKHAGLQEFIASNNLKAFCKARTELIWKKGNISLLQATPSGHLTEKGSRSRPIAQEEVVQVKSTIPLAQEIARPELRPQWQQRAVAPTAPTGPATPLERS